MTGVPSANVTAQAMVGVVGGSGLYELFDRGEDVDIATPYGATVRVTIGRIGEHVVAFVPRHGRDHSVPPHRIDARSCIWALAALGVKAMISTAAVGSLNPELPVGTIALASQLVDRTHGRADTFFDGNVVRHLPFSDPFDNALRTVALDACPELSDGATVLVIQGPRFSTRAESHINRAGGVDLVNMTLYPEIALAAELGIDAAALCLVTDLDTGETSEDAVTAEAVFAVLHEAKPRLVGAIERIVTALPADYAARELIDRAAIDAVVKQ
ncbi:MTAP family purine nucleoside phosphorylase [Microbacterium sp. R86528]|uniref:MTAP family purine nucleoside phosphorylase n=1 Tax=Microbacterium sp. R86528 TaxID=3093864 RepID=UPI0037C72CDB